MPLEHQKGPRNKVLHPGDPIPRLTCEDCGFIHYENPKIVVGSVVLWNDLFLLCKRDIEPRRGFWTLPAGFLELNETPEEGAIREASEEALADISIERLLSVYTVKSIGQIQIFYLARLKNDQFGIGAESQEVRLYAWNDIPWSDLAFPTVHRALKDYERTKGDPKSLPISCSDFGVSK